MTKTDLPYIEYITDMVVICDLLVTHRPPSTISSPSSSVPPGALRQARILSEKGADPVTGQSFGAGNYRLQERPSQFP